MLPREKRQRRRKDILLLCRREKAVKYGISNHPGIQRRQSNHPFKKLDFTILTEQDDVKLEILMSNESLTKFIR